VNLTLKAIDATIAEGNKYLSNQNFDLSLTTFENARKNNFPSTIAQNISLQKSIASAKSQKAAYIQKLEQERIVEERKREQERLADQKRKQEQAKAFYSELETITINYIVNRLKSPSTASVVNFNNPDVTRKMLNESGNYLPNCDNVFATMLTVDAQNSFGAYIRSTYVLFFKNNKPCHWEDVKSIDRARQSQSTVGMMNSMLQLTLDMNGCGCK
jgi:hypothetical protein